MKPYCPAGLLPSVIARRRGSGLPLRAIRAGLFILVATSLSMGCAYAEPQVLVGVKFFGTLMPEVHPVLSDHLMRTPMVFAEPPAPAVRPMDIRKLVAADLLESGEGSIKLIAGDRITARDVMRKQAKLQKKPEPKFEPFGLVKTMPASYAGVMFGVGWLLLLISVALGYLGREITPYTADDPATWNPEIQRPLAAILLEPHIEC